MYQEAGISIQKETKSGRVPGWGLLEAGPPGPQGWALGHLVFSSSLCIVTGYFKLVAMVGRTGGKDRRGRKWKSVVSLYIPMSLHMLFLLVSLPLVL